MLSANTNRTIADKKRLERFNYFINVLIDEYKHSRSDSFFLFDRDSRCSDNGEKSGIDHAILCGLKQQSTVLQQSADGGCIGVQINLKYWFIVVSVTFFGCRRDRRSRFSIDFTSI